MGDGPWDEHSTIPAAWAQRPGSRVKNCIVTEVDAAMPFFKSINALLEVSRNKGVERLRIKLDRNHKSFFGFSFYGRELNMKKRGLVLAA